MVRVRTLFVPYRLVLSGSAPYVDLEITVENPSIKEKLLSLEVLLPHELSFNPGGYIRRQSVRLGKIGPKTSKKVSVRIYARSTTVPGGYPVTVIVFEHEGDYEYVKNEWKKEIVLNAV